MRRARWFLALFPMLVVLAATGCGEPVIVEKDPVKAEESNKMQAEMWKQERSGK